MLVAAFAAWATSCSNGGSSFVPAPAPGPGSSGSAVIVEGDIGPSGGSLFVATGADAGVAVSVPAGAVTVPTYVTNTAADHAHVLRDSGARVAIAATPALARRVLEGAARAQGLDLLVCLDGRPEAAPAGTRVTGWEALEAAPGDLPLLLAEVEQIPAGRLACLIYTSGTGGSPKGVMLPHRAMLANREGLARALLEKVDLDGTRYLSFLPLSHSYEHTVGCFLLPSLGMEVVYSRGAERLSNIQ